VEEGDEVIIFGSRLPVQEIAERAGTIPYEIMTGISQRVRRVYYEE
jgi:alanine racemase